MGYENGVFQIMVTAGTFNTGGFLVSGVGQQSGEVTEVYQSR